MNNLTKKKKIQDLLKGIRFNDNEEWFLGELKIDDRNGVDDIDCYFRGTNLGDKNYKNFEILFRNKITETIIKGYRVFELLINDSVYLIQIDFELTNIINIELHNAITFYIEDILND